MTMNARSRLKWSGAALVAIAVLICLAACQPKQSKIAPESAAPTIAHPDVYPVDLKAEPGDNLLTLRWSQHGTGTISGYNIFIANAPLVKPNGEFSGKQSPHNTSVYPGDTNPDDSVVEYVADGLNNGVKYYAAVSVVYPDQTMSRPTNEVLAVCGPRGEFELGIRYKSDNDGFSLVSGEQVRADASANDLYYYAKDGEDFLASPSRLDGYRRKTRFLLVGREGSFANIAAKVNAGEFKNDAGDEKLAVKAGNWVLARTDEKYSALIHVKAVSGTNDSRVMRLSFALCMLVGETSF